MFLLRTRLPHSSIRLQFEMLSDCDKALIIAAPLANLGLSLPFEYLSFLKTVPITCIIKSSIRLQVKPSDCDKA